MSVETVYKIKITGLDTDDYWKSRVTFAHGANIWKAGGSGKTWTNLKLVNKCLDEIKRLHGYGKEYQAEIIVYELTEVGCL